MKQDCAHMARQTKPNTAFTDRLKMKCRQVAGINKGEFYQKPLERITMNICLQAVDELRYLG
jgi:hypothetical protein